jgi:hypothetical protein
MELQKENLVIFKIQKEESPNPITQYGKIPAVGEEYAGREVYVFVKKEKEVE